MNIPILHRTLNTILILAGMYILYQAVCEKDVKQCEYILLDELRGE